MNRHIDDVLSKLDRSLRWTGIPARVAADQSDSPLDRNWRPLRWMPLWAIAYSSGLFVLSLVHPSLLDASLQTFAVAMLPAIWGKGPLGKPSIEDDEREAALRKDSLLFCLAVLAGLNCIGQPLLAILSQLRSWTGTHIAIAAGSSLMLNLCLFGTLPTLYASWALPKLPQE